MIIRCPKCRLTCQVDSDLEVGQHVVCPNCGVKFSYLQDGEPQGVKTSDFSHVKYFGEDPQGSWARKVSKAWKIFLCVFAAFIFLGAIGSCLGGRGTRPNVKMPFNHISWQWLSGGQGQAMYIINTDAPANAQLIATYVMGRLYDVQIMRASDKQKGEAVKQIVKTLYDLEAELRAMGK